LSVIYESYKPTSKKNKSNVPITLKWNNISMIRNHSINACARELLQANVSNEVVKVNLIGPPSTGKTTLAKTLAHLVHSLSKNPYAVKIFKRDDLMNMEETLSKLPPMNHVLVFDDVSWLSAGNSKQKIDQVQKTFSEIRHLPGGQDVKIIIMFNFHYNLAIAKHLRQADFFIYTDIGSSELENTEKLVGAKYRDKLFELKKIRNEIKATSKEATDSTPEYHGTFSHRIPGKGNVRFTYQHRNPFAPALWWNGDSLRHIVFPQREWILPICATCTGSIEATAEGQVDLQKFKSEIVKRYGTGTVKSALKLKLYQHGINTWPPSVKNCMGWIEQYMNHKLFNLVALAEEFGLEDKPTKVRKKLPDDILHPKESVQP
jgi:energy-coupling factor transporter ATP-binding protein EcfA2